MRFIYLRLISNIAMQTCKHYKLANRVNLVDFFGLQYPRKFEVSTTYRI